MGRNRRHDIVKPSKYKTSMCSFFVSPGGCPFGDHCAFAHGDAELRVESKDNAPPPDAIIGIQPLATTEPEAATTPTSAGGAAEGGKGGNGGGSDRQTSGGFGKKNDAAGDVTAAANSGGGGGQKGTGGGGVGKSQQQKPQKHRTSSNGGKDKAAHGRSSKARQTPPSGLSLQQPQFPSQMGGGMSQPGMRGLGPTSGGFQSLAEMPYSTNSAVPNAPLYIPTNFAQHPYFNINNSHQFLNVLTEAPLTGTSTTTTGAGRNNNHHGNGSFNSHNAPTATTGFLGQGSMIPPYTFFGSGPQQQQQQQLYLQATSGSSSGQRSSGKNTPGGSPQPAVPHVRTHVNVVSSNTLANAGHSRGGRTHHQHGAPAQPAHHQRQQSHSGHSGHSGRSSGMTSPSTFGTFSAPNNGNSNNNVYANPAAAAFLLNGGMPPTNTNAKLSLQDLLASPAPPTVVHIPFESPSRPWEANGGVASAGPDRRSSEPIATAPGSLSSTQQLNSFLQQQSGDNYYAYTFLPCARGLPTQAQAAAATAASQLPPQQPQQVPQNLSLENLLASLEGQQNGTNPLGRNEENEDEDDDTKSNDWSAFLETWLRRNRDGSSSVTTIVPKEAEDAAADPTIVGSTVKPSEVAASAPTTTSEEATARTATAQTSMAALSSATPSNPQPVALALSKPAVQLSGAPVSLAGPVPATAPSLSAARGPSDAAEKPAARKRPLLCSVFRANAYDAPDTQPSATAAAAAASSVSSSSVEGGKAAAARRRTPIMRNHFKRTCIPAEVEKEAEAEADAPTSSTSLLLYCAEKNMLYYITAPTAVERKLKGSAAATTATSDTKDAAGDAPNMSHREADSDDKPNGSNLGNPTSATTTDTATSETASAAVQARGVPPGLVTVADERAAVEEKLRRAAANGDRIIRCRPPLRRYQRTAEEQVDDDGIEYCI